METTTIELKISEDVITQYGLDALQEKMQCRMDWEDLRLKALKLKAFLDEHELDYYEIAEEARSRAWEIHKRTVLKDILPDE